MHKVLCSTGALIGRPNGRDYRLLEQFCPQLDCDGFEFMLYSTWYDRIDELGAFLRRIKLHIPVFHCEKSLSEHISEGSGEELREAFRLFEINCRMAETAGAGKMVLHLWNGKISDTRFENNLKAYPQLKETAEKHGIQLLVENVICLQEPLSHWVELYRHYPDILFVFDTKMAEFHRQLDQLYQPEYDWLWKEKHICHYHVNDYDGGYMDWSNLKVLPLGRGHINFTQFFRFVGETGYKGDFTFEATGFDQSGEVDFTALNEQFSRAREYIRTEVQHAVRNT